MATDLAIGAECLLPPEVLQLLERRLRDKVNFALRDALIEFRHPVDGVSYLRGTLNPPVVPADTDPLLIAVQISKQVPKHCRANSRDAWSESSAATIVSRSTVSSIAGTLADTACGIEDPPVAPTLPKSDITGPPKSNVRRLWLSGAAGVLEDHESLKKSRQKQRREVLKRHGLTMAQKPTRPSIGDVVQKLRALREGEDSSSEGKSGSLSRYDIADSDASALSCSSGDVPDANTLWLDVCTVILRLSGIYPWSVTDAFWRHAGSSESASFEGCAHWSVRCRSASMWYQWVLALVYTASSVWMVCSSVRALMECSASTIACEDVAELRYLAIALLPVLGIFILGVPFGSKRIVLCLDLLLRYAARFCYKREHDLVDFQEAVCGKVRLDAITWSFVWIVSCLYRIWGRANGPSRPHAALDEISFMFVSLMSFAMCFCMIYVCTFLRCLVEMFPELLANAHEGDSVPVSYTRQISHSRDPLNSAKAIRKSIARRPTLHIKAISLIDEWTVLQTIHGETIDDIENCLVAILVVFSMYTLLNVTELLFFYSGKQQSAMKVASILWPSTLSIFMTVRLLYGAAQITDACDRMPSLASMKNIDFFVRRDIVQYMYHSHVGCDIHGVRITPVLVIKYAYIWFMVMFSLVSSFSTGLVDK